MGSDIIIIIIHLYGIRFHRCFNNEDIYMAESGKRRLENEALSLSRDVSYLICLMEAD